MGNNFSLYKSSHKFLQACLHYIFSSNTILRERTNDTSALQWDLQLDRPPSTQEESGRTPGTIKILHLVSEDRYKWQLLLSMRVNCRNSSSAGRVGAQDPENANFFFRKLIICFFRNYGYNNIISFMFLSSVKFLLHA